eukprot:jgi/Ulvmu1/6646/UM003_0284.1
MIDRWISEVILAVLRRFVDIDWENLQIGWWSGFTLDDICIRQDIFASLGLPMELHEGKIRRLHISGDWTYSSGLRPRIEISGVRIIARVAVPNSSAAVSTTSASATAATQKPSSSVLRALLRRLCAVIADVEVVLVDNLTPCMRPMSAGISIRSISTEDSAAARLSPAASSAPAGAPCSHLTVEIGGAFIVPAAAPAHLPWLQGGWQDLPPPATPGLHPDAVTDIAAAQEWLVVHPCSILGIIETSVADGSGTLCASVHAMLPNIALKVSPWQIADAVRVYTSAAAAAQRARFAHLRPRELRALTRGSQPRKPPRRVAVRAAWRGVAVRAAWRFAVLAVRAQLRTEGGGGTARARAGRARRALARHRTYIAACAVLVLLRQDVDADTAARPASLESLATSLLHWLSMNRSDANGVSGAATAGLLPVSGGWCGNQRPSGSTLPIDTHPDSPDLCWLHDAVAINEDAADALSWHALILLRAADDPLSSAVTVKHSGTTGAGKKCASAALASHTVEVAVPDDGLERTSEVGHALEGPVWQYGAPLEAVPSGDSAGEASEGEPAGVGAAGARDRRAILSVAELIQVAGAAAACIAECDLPQLHAQAAHLASRLRTGTAAAHPAPCSPEASDCLPEPHARSPFSTPVAGPMRSPFPPPPPPPTPPVQLVLQFRVRKVALAILDEVPPSPTSRQHTARQHGAAEPLPGTGVEGMHSSDGDSEADARGAAVATADAAADRATSLGDSEDNFCFANIRVATPFEDPGQAPGSRRPSPPATASPLATGSSHLASVNSNHSGSGSASFGSPVATPSAGRPWPNSAATSAAFVTPQSMASALSGASWKSAADTWHSIAPHPRAGSTPEATGADPPECASAQQPTSSPESSSDWKAPRQVEPAVILEADDISMATAGMPGGSMTMHVQSVAAWEAGPLCSSGDTAADVTSSPGQGASTALRGPRGTKLLHSTAASAAWLAGTARSVATMARAPSVAPSVAGSECGLSIAVPPHRSASSWLLNVRSRPSIGGDVLLRHDSLPHSARRSSTLSRSASLSILQVQGSRTPPFAATAAFDAPQYGPPPLVTVTTCMEPMRTDIVVTPLTVTVTPGLIDFSTRCVKPFQLLLPAAAEPTAMPLPPRTALLAHANAAAEAAVTPQTLSLRMHGLAAGVTLPAPAASQRSGGEEVSSLLPRIYVGELQMEAGSVCDAERMARMLDDVEVARAHACVASMSSGGRSSGSGGSMRGGAAGGDGEGVAGELWAHAGAGETVRLPHAALAAALTVPMHASVAEVSLGIEEHGGGVWEDEGPDAYLAPMMHDVAATVPLLTLAEASVTACMPAAEFAPVQADVGVSGLRSTVSGEDVTRVQEAVEAGKKLVPQQTAQRGGGPAALQQRPPWLQVRGSLDDVWLRAVGACAGDACIEATLVGASATYTTPGPSGAGTVPHHAWATCTVSVRDLALAQLSGKIDAVLPDAAPFVPRGIRRAVLRAASVHVALDAATGELQQLAGEARGVRVTADAPSASQTGFWDASAGGTVCVIGPSVGWGSPVERAEEASMAQEGPGAAQEGGAHVEAVVRFAFVAPGTAGGSERSCTEAAAVTSVLICNACVCTLFLAEIMALVDTHSRPDTAPTEGEDTPNEAVDALCTSVEILRSELASPAPVERPHAGIRNSEGSAVLRLGRLCVVVHPGWLEEDMAVARAAVAVMRRCAEQAGWLRRAQQSELAHALRGPLHGASPGSSPPWPSFELSTSSLLFASATSGLLPTPSLTFKSALSALPSLRSTASSSIPPPTDLSPEGPPITIVAIDDVSLLVDGAQHDAPASLPAVLMPHDSSPMHGAGPEPQQGDAAARLASVRVTLGPRGGHACELDGDASGVHATVSAEQVQVLACMLHMHAAKWNSAGGAAESGGLELAAPARPVVLGGARRVNIDASNFDGAESDDDDDAAVVKLGRGDALNAVLHSWGAAVFGGLKKVLTRSAAVSIGPCSLTLRAAAHAAAVPASSVAGAPVGLRLQSQGLRASAGPAGEGQPSAGIHIQPLTLTLLTHDAAAASPPVSTRAASTPGLTSSPMRTTHTNAISGPAPRQYEEPAARSTLVAQLSSACVMPAEGPGQGNIFGGLGAPVDIRATPGHPIAVEAELTAGGGSCGMHVAVTLRSAVLVIDAGHLSAVHRVAAHVFAPIAAGSSSSSGGSVSTGGTMKPPVPLAPVREMRAARVSSTRQTASAAAAHASGPKMTCAVTAEPVAVALLLPVPGGVGGNVAIVAHACASASAEVRQQLARCAAALPEVTLHAAPADPCSVLCEGLQPLVLRPASCVAEVSQSSASVTVTSAEHTQLQSQHTAHSSVRMSSMLDSLPAEHAHTRREGQHSPSVVIEAESHAIQVAVGSEEVAVVHQLMHVIGSPPAAVPSRSEAADSTCSTGTPPASHHRSLATSLPLPTATAPSQESSYTLAPVQGTRPPQKTLVDTIIDATSSALTPLCAVADWTLRCTIHAVHATVLQRHAVGGCGCAMHAPHALSCALHADAPARGGLVVTPLATVALRPHRQQRTLRAVASAAGLRVEAAAAVEVRVLSVPCQEWDVLMEEWPLELRAGMQPQHTAGTAQAQQRRSARTWDAHLHLRAESLLTSSLSDAYVPALRAATMLLDGAASPHNPSGQVSGGYGSSGSGPNPAPAGPPLSSSARVSPSAGLAVASRHARGHSTLPRSTAHEAASRPAAMGLPARVLSTLAAESQERPIVIKNFTGLPLTITPVPLTPWPLAPTAHIPASAAAAQRDSTPSTPPPLMLPPSPAHVLLSTRDIFTRGGGGAAAAADIDCRRFGISVMVTLPPGSLAPAGGTRPTRQGNPVTQFLPFRCFPLTDPVLRSEAVAMVRSDGSRAPVTLCAEARLGAAACPEICVHACVRIHNMLPRTLLLRPCHADPRISAAGHAVRDPAAACMAIPPDTAAYLPADCAAARGVQLCLTPPDDTVTGAHSLKWTTRVPLLQPKARSTPEQPQDVRKIAAQCAGAAVSVRQHAVPAQPSGAAASEPYVTHVSVRPAVCLVNATPVAAMVAVSGADPVAVPPFAATGVLLPSTALFAQLAVTLDKCEASGAVTVAPGRPAIVHCKHLSSTQATSTVTAALARTADAVCIVLSAHACVLNVTPVPLHVVTAHAQRPADVATSDKTQVATVLMPRSQPRHLNVRLSEPATPPPQMPRSASSTNLASRATTDRRVTVPARPHSAKRLPSMDSMDSMSSTAQPTPADAPPGEPCGGELIRRATVDTCLDSPAAATASASVVPALAQLEHLWPHVAPAAARATAPRQDVSEPPALAGLADLLPPLWPQRQRPHTPQRADSAPAAHAARLPRPAPAAASVPEEPTATQQTPADAAGSCVQPVLLSLPPTMEGDSATDAAEQALLHISRFGDVATVVPAARTAGRVLRLQALRRNTLALRSPRTSASSSQLGLRVPLRPGAAHAVKLDISMHVPGAFGDNAAVAISGLDHVHPAQGVLAAVAPPAIVYVTPMHVVANRMHAHVALEQPQAGEGRIAPLTHQLLAPGTTSLLLAGPPRDSSGSPWDDDEEPAPSVRVTASDSGCKRFATVPLKPSLPVPILLTASNVPPSATTMHTTAIQPRVEAPPHAPHAPGAPLPFVTCTMLDPFVDECATVHIVNLTAHSLRAYQPELSPNHPAANSRSSLPQRAETMDNFRQDVPPHSRRPFLWDSVLSARIARRMGNMQTNVPTMPSIKLCMDVGVSIDVHVNHASGWPVAVSDWLGTGAMKYRCPVRTRLGSARIFADGALALDARAVADRLLVDVRRRDLWRIEVVVSEVSDPGVRTTADTSAATVAAPLLRPRSCLRADVSVAGVLVTVVHAARAREVLVAKVAGVEACMRVDDEGNMHAHGSVAALRATNSHKLALFRVMAAAPVVTSRTTQGWSYSTEQAAQVDVTGTLTPHSLAISSAVLAVARLALQLEADFVNGAISATHSFARAALPAPITAAAAAVQAPRALSPQHASPSTQHAITTTPVGLLLTAAQPSTRSTRAACASSGAAPLTVPPPATGQRLVPRVTVAGVRVAPFAVTFSFSAPRRAPAATEVVGAAAADGVEPPGVLGRAVSSLLAVAGISAANLTLPAFRGPNAPTDPAAVARLWGDRINAGMRMNAPWLIGAMDILGSPAQLFSLLYGSLSDLLALPARNTRLALAYARGAAPANAAEPALGEGLPPPGVLRFAALVAALSSSSLRVAADAAYAIAAASRRSVAALHQLTAHLMPEPFEPTLGVLPLLLALPTASVGCFAATVRQRPLWMLPASLLIASAKVAFGGVCMPAALVLGYCVLACEACMHAMCPQQLNATIRTPRTIFRSLPLGPYQPLQAASAAALTSIAPVATGMRLPVCHVTPLHPEPLPAAHPIAETSTSGRKETRSAGLPAAQPAAPVAALTPVALHILQLPEVKSPAPATLTGSAALLTRLPLRTICSSAADGEWLEVVYTAPAGHAAGGRDGIVVPTAAEHEMRAVSVSGTAGRAEAGVQASMELMVNRDAAHAVAHTARTAQEPPREGAVDSGRRAPTSDSDGGGAQQEAAPAAEGPAQGLGLPFRVLRVRCASVDGAAELHAALGVQRRVRAETLRRRAPLPLRAAVQEEEPAA